jgi:glycerophosphoryl diester phosphodiesterase
VRPCQSGEVVVFHDCDLRRLAGDPRNVCDVAFDELRSFDLGDGARIPTLLEVLSLCHDRRLWLNVELKRDVPHRRIAARTTAAALGRARTPVVVSCFDPAMLAWFALYAPFVRRGLLLSTKHRWVHALARGWVDSVHPDRRLVSASAVARWRDRGLAVHTWTVNDPAEARALVEAGVDGVMTDDPATLRAILR